MSQTPPIPPQQPVRPPPQLQPTAWPVWLSLAMMTLSVGWLIAIELGFDAAAWYASGWFWLATLALMVAALAGLAMRTRDRIGDRMQTAVILSLLLHIFLAVVLKEQFISLIVDMRRDVDTAHITPLPTVPRYFFPPVPTESSHQAFERPIETALAAADTQSLARQTQSAQRPDRTSADRRVDFEPASLVHERRQQTAPRRSEAPARMSRQLAEAAEAQHEPIRAPREPRSARTAQRPPVARAPREPTERISRPPEPPSTPQWRTPRRRQPPSSPAQVIQRADQEHQPQSVSTPTPRRQVEAGRLAETQANDLALPQITRSEATLNLKSSVAALTRSAASLPAARSVSGPTLRTQRQESALGQPRQARRTQQQNQPSGGDHDSLRNAERIATLPRTTANTPAATVGFRSTPTAESDARFTAEALDRSPLALPAARRGGGTARSVKAVATRDSSTDSLGRRGRTTQTRPRVVADGTGNHVTRQQTNTASLDGGAATARDVAPSLAARESSALGAANVQPQPSGTEISRNSSGGQARRRGNLGQTASTSRLMQSATANRGSGVPRRTAADRLTESVGQRSTGRPPTLTRVTVAATLPGSATVAETLRDADQEDTAPRATTGDGDRVAATSGRGERLSRSSSQLPTRQQTQLAGGGVELSRLGSPGIADRRARRDSSIVSPTAQRFLARRSTSAASADSVAREPTASFARRAARQQVHNAQPQSPSPQVESAIENGLAYLASIQQDDGRWTLQHTAPPGATDARSRIKADSAATGLALLAFLGAGYDHFDNRYRSNVERGLQFLIGNQQDNGDLYLTQTGPSNNGVWLYSHGIAALALCEAFGMTGDQQLRTPAQRALDFITAAQHPQRGGWRYAPREQADLSVSGWQLMALRSGQLAGLQVQATTMRRAQRLLDLTQSPASGGGQYVYNPWGGETEQHRFGRRPNAVMTSVGLLMRLYTGSSRSDPSIQRGANVLLQRLASADRPPEFVAAGNPFRDTYYWYNATQVMFHMQGEYWQQWQASLYPLLIKTQQATGPLRGSWDPYRPVPDRWGFYAGRLYLTAMNLLSLEVYHRHLPLFDEGLAVNQDAGAP